MKTRSVEVQTSNKQNGEAMCLSHFIHSFPKEEKLRKKWEDACGRVQLPTYRQLCSCHFTSDLTGGLCYKRQLKPDAVPTIFLHKKPKHPRVTNCTASTSCQDEGQTGLNIP
uniref:THAP domain-containing protein 1 n=1 Tax=Salarias fasciatus TaxID=181472 RepID=A0A672FC85_SALFA